jgi:aminoglycoside phosphotransferase (APT) family kinase protein
VNLPDFPAVSDETLRAAAARLGLGRAVVSPMPEVGIFNAIFALGPDLVLRIPRNHPAFVGAARKEAVAVPAARAAGVRTPELVAYDDSLELLPVPYTVYERVRGETLGLLDLEPTATPAVWRELGRDLARLHLGVSPAGPAAGLALEALPDPRGLPDELAQRGLFTTVEARWLSGLLERFAGLDAGPPEPRFLHGDTQATNVMVAAGSLEYLAVLDWGGSGWGDPALDFQGMPLRAVPHALQGYRELAPAGEGSVEARVLWGHLQLGLLNLGRPPQPGRSWGERPLGYLLEMLRFMLEPPEGWAELLRR